MVDRRINACLKLAAGPVSLPARHRAEAKMTHERTFCVGDTRAPVPMPARAVVLGHAATRCNLDGFR